MLILYIPLIFWVVIGMGAIIGLIMIIKEK